MTWKPSENLHAAIALVEQLDEEGRGADVNINRAFKWRIIQVVSEALEEAYNAGREAAIIESVEDIEGIVDKYRTAEPVEGLPTVTVTNGQAGVSVAAPVLDWIENHPANYAPPEGETPFDPPKPVKRGRGRPKGAKGKKKKAAKAAAVVPAMSAPGGHES